MKRSWFEKPVDVRHFVFIIILRTFFQYWIIFLYFCHMPCLLFVHRSLTLSAILTQNIFQFEELIIGGWRRRRRSSSEQYALMGCPIILARSGWMGQLLVNLNKPIWKPYWDPNKERILAQYFQNTNAKDSKKDIQRKQLTLNIIMAWWYKLSNLYFWRYGLPYFCLYQKSM